MEDHLYSYSVDAMVYSLILRSGFKPSAERCLFTNASFSQINSSTLFDTSNNRHSHASLSTHCPFFVSIRPQILFYKINNDNYEIKCSLYNKNIADFYSNSAYNINYISNNSQDSLNYFMNSLNYSDTSLKNFYLSLKKSGTSLKK